MLSVCLVITYRSETHEKLEYLLVYRTFQKHSPRYVKAKWEKGANTTLTEEEEWLIDVEEIPPPQILFDEENFRGRVLLDFTGLCFRMCIIFALYI